MHLADTFISEMTYSALITGTLIPLEQPGVKSPAEGHTDGDDQRSIQQPSAYQFTTPQK